MFKRGAGILAHPTSFDTQYGIGDLGSSTIKFLDFLENAKQKYWQILPLGPTSFLDSPYQSFSTFAGNTLLISPEILIQEKLLQSSDVYNELPREFVDYGRVSEFKNKIFTIAFQNFIKDTKSNDYKKFLKFCKDNASWLDDYSLFVSLKKYYIEERRNSFETEDLKKFQKDNKKYLTENEINDYFYGGMWLSFDTDIKNREKDAIKKWTVKLENETLFEKFLQYKFFAQWDNIKAEAKKREISIIGDIPIFVSLDSSDVWANRDLFQLDKYGRPKSVAGVPPDYFSETGQLWGNPLYDFAKHKKDDYAWWIERFASSQKMYDIIRIDHFRGFSEYWSVPYGDETAINGKWIEGPSYDLFDTVFKKFKDIKIIAEDLGLLTDDVLELRDHYNLPGMKILQFAFSDKGNLYLPHNFTTSNCLIYTGTHDNDTTLGFYNKASEEEKDYIRRYLNIDGANIAYDFTRLAYSSCADVCIIPMQDVLNEETYKRMNTPSVKIGNWQYRFPEYKMTDIVSQKLEHLVKLYNR